MRIFNIILAFLLITRVASAGITLPGIVADNMVLQRDSKLTIWGWATPGENVTVKFMGKTYNAKPGQDDKWVVKLSPIPAGGPYEMNIDGSASHIMIKNIMIGDVWLCSGQSNMQLDFNNGGVKALYAADIAASANDNIRQVVINRTYSSYPLKNYKTSGWKMASPQTLPAFSAAAYFFAKELYEKYHVTIGLINSCVGGTMAEAWTSERGLKDLSQFSKDIQFLKDTVTLKAKISQSKTDLALWESKNLNEDKGFDDKHNAQWASEAFDDSQWQIVNQPAFWDTYGYKNNFGTAWLRKEVSIPDDWMGKAATLDIGQVDDADITYFNGTEIGKGLNRDARRKYPVPASLIKAGRNVITIRITNFNGTGGLFPENKMTLASGNASIPLAGAWKFQQGIKLDVRQGVYDPKNMPTGLNNAMIAPLAPVEFKGVIWYQGEFNYSRAYEYRSLFPALIKDWRENFDNSELPFIFVQLPNFQPLSDRPTENPWAELREAQAMALSLPNTAMAVTIDIGGNDLHPANKKDVGIRLALAARKLVYGEKKLVASGPLYKSMRVQDNKIILTFDDGGSKLTSKDGKDLRYFSIAGEDHKFIWATAKLVGNTVEVSAPTITKPIAVRYAWAGNPEGCNLFNEAGLPASPFRTDNFPGVTFKNHY